MRTPSFSYYEAVFDAAERIILRSGCGAATVRAVATEAGLSPSTVRHHYPTQSLLLACAFAGIEDHFARALWSAPVRDEDATVADVVKTLATRLPTGGHGLHHLRLLHAYKAWARHDWDMAVLVSAHDRRLLQLCQRLCLGMGLRRAQAQRQGAILRALLTGLAEEIVTIAVDPPEGGLSLGVADRLTDRGVRAILTQHVTAVRAMALSEEPGDGTGGAARNGLDGRPVDRSG
jgi:AcrR family transcriptional regulator